MNKVKKLVPYVSGGTYNFVIQLTQDCYDLGVFDVYDDPFSTSVGEYNTGKATTISGVTVNRLTKIRTFSQSSDITKRYLTSTIPSSNGLNMSLSVFTAGNEKYVYYIDNVTYTTTITSATTKTIFSYVSVHGNSVLFENKPIIKLEDKMHHVENPRIDPDVFIVRQSLPVFTDNYRLAEITRMEQLYKYGSGYFNIIDNI